MLDALRFVQGAVAKKDFVPELLHFKIENGIVRGYNGSLALCCPIDLDLNASPKAVPFVKAIQTCKETIQLHMTASGKLSVKSGTFKALVECSPEVFPEVIPEGLEAPLNSGILPVLKVLAPFIAEDASRPWARGILFRGGSAFATNNVCLVEHWLGEPFPVEINLPKSAVTELLRIGEEPERIQVSEHSATFHFAGNRWLRTQTYTTQWPDLSRVLDNPSKQVEVPSGLFEAVASLKPFVSDTGRLFLHPSGTISTSQSEDEGAKVELSGLTDTGCFHFEQIALLEPVAKTIDLSLWPAPCMFQGDKLRGAIVGMRLV
jgi:DNA polymerase III sliding clamp (beta) subunit (PCNA family)